jgi:uncharacterized protein YfbU (UPF0304 family)
LQHRVSDLYINKLIGDENQQSYNQKIKLINDEVKIVKNEISKEFDDLEK